jgi:cytolysin (calcineurin-like family phosphatase)
MNRFPQSKPSLGLSRIPSTQRACPSFFETFWPHALLLLAFLSGVASAHSQTVPPPAPPLPRTDATFTMTSDIHVAFNGYDDHQGIDATLAGSPLNSFLIYNETLDSSAALGSHHDGCVGTVTKNSDGSKSSPFGTLKDLCNDIQLVRKLNHVESNTWNSVSFTRGYHSYTLAGGGQTIGLPRGLIVSGDLTDCGAGSYDVLVGVHSETCLYPYVTRFETPECPTPNWAVPGCGIEGQELTMIEQLFDRNAGQSFKPLSSYPVIAGLNNPDGDIPLKFNLYPGLGNHDLGSDLSGHTMDYIRNWSSVMPAGNPRHVTHNDPYSGDYSWDWGNLHILNVGVYAGSGNQSQADDSNYEYSQDTMNWIAGDLFLYARDGRPVIIVQHFGFDPLSWSTAWYLAPSHKQGAANLWPMLANYNVVGIFHGHDHIEGIYSFAPGSQYDGNLLFPAAHVPYDIFNSGAGYNQEFLLAHVTDTFMDVQATTPGDDFDNTQTTVDFSDYFTKRLVGAPVLGSPSNIEQGAAIASSFQIGSKSFVVSATASGQFTVRVVDSANVFQYATGTFAVQPKFLAAYTYQNQGYFLVSDGNRLVDYAFSPTTGKVSLFWSEYFRLASMTVLYAPNGSPYLVSESDQGTQVGFPINALSRTGMTEVGYNQFTATQGEFSQMVVVPTTTGNFLLVRYNPNGVAEMYTISLDSGGSFSLIKNNDEEWGADALSPDSNHFHFGVLVQPVTFKDATVGILVKSTACTVYDPTGTVCLAPDTVDSPYVLRTLTPDNNGTEISWRGNIFLSNTANQVALAPIGSVNGNPEVAMYSNYGTLTRIIVNP